MSKTKTIVDYRDIVWKEMGSEERRRFIVEIHIQRSEHNPELRIADWAENESFSNLPIEAQEALSGFWNGHRFSTAWFEERRICLLEIARNSLRRQRRERTIVKSIRPKAPRRA